MRRLVAAAGALGLSASLIGAGAGVASAAAAPERRIAVCEHRLCLLVLEESSDSDGDGVTDVDEEFLGSDPKDPQSYPEVAQILDAAIARELPSFEQHLTELVSLPRDTPDGVSLATGVGALQRPEKGPLLRSTEETLDTVATNGFENLGSDVTTLLADRPSLSETERLLFAARGNVAVVGTRLDDGIRIEEIVGPTDFGANRDLDPLELIEEGFSYGDGDSLVRHAYSVIYGGGARDDVLGSTMYGAGGSRSSMIGIDSYGPAGHRTGSTTVTSETDEVSRTQGTVNSTGYDEDGNRTGSGTTTFDHYDWTNPEGTTGTDTVSDTTNYDGDGKQTDRTTTIYSTATYPDGRTETRNITTSYDEKGNPTSQTVVKTVNDGETTTTTTKTTTYDEDGNVVEEETTTETCKNEECKNGGQEGMVNPDYVGVGPITGDDLARVAVRFNSNRTPSEDDWGQIDPGDIPPMGPGWDPTIALVNPDGVTTFAVGGTPSFNGATPEYDPDLQQIIDISGIDPPNRTDPVSWP